MKDGDLRVSFAYTGTAYVRPAGRGILLHAKDVADGSELDAFLRPGFYRVELRFVPIEEPPEAP